MKREERVCKECNSGEVEDVGHWLLQCSAWDHSALYYLWWDQRRF